MLESNNQVKMENVSIKAKLFLFILHILRDNNMIPLNQHLFDFMYDRKSNPCSFSVLSIIKKSTLFKKYLENIVYQSRE